MESCIDTGNQTADLRRVMQLILPRSLVPDVLRTLHDAPTVGHLDHQDAEQGACKVPLAWVESRRGGLVPIM